MLGIFHCQQNSKLCLGDVTEREKVQWVSFFSIKISWNWKTGSQRQKLFCVAVRLLCVKSHKSIWLGTFWTFGHLFWSHFAFQSLLPNPNLPHCTLHKFTIEWRGEEFEEGGYAGTTRNLVPGKRAGRKEDQKQWLKRSHTPPVRAGRWVSVGRSSTPAPCGDETEGDSNSSALY